MKYIALVYSAPGAYEALSDTEREAFGRDADAFFTTLTESGELVGGEGLAHPSEARTVRGRDGVPAVTDGPFAEAKEHLAGYYVLDCPSIDRAVELVSTHDPAARAWSVEVRPLLGQA